MKTKLQLAALALALATLNSQLTTAHAQGALTPPGAPAPTMKSLDQVEARTPISSAPFTISQPGSYYLTGNLTVSTGNGINITTNGVTLDLNGFTIRSTAASATGNGITINSGLRNLTIVNGFIQGGVTNNFGVYGGSGFASGIVFSGISPKSTRASHISVSGCLSFGIALGNGESTVAEACTVRTVGGLGIGASSIKNCTAVDCGGSGILGDQVSDSRGESTGSSTGVSAETALNCYGESNTGTGLSATTALNCRGQNSTGSFGLTATTAQNCYGYSAGSGTGLYASATASGCYGYSSTGTGLNAFIANVCRGQSSTGTALSVTHNVNSF